MSAGLGRFMSPDPANAGADFTNPQSWNGYGYVLGNPLALVDPSGLCSSSDNPPCYSVVGVAKGDPDYATTTNPVDLSSWISFLNYGMSLLFGSSGSGPGGGGVPVYTVTGTGVADRNPQPVSTPPKSGVCNNLPAGTSPEFCAALQQGLQNALNALKRNRCGNFYGGRGPQTLDATQYRFLDMQKPTTGAATISPNNVFVNSKGPYMTYTPTQSQTGPFGRYWTQGQFRGFILLHELGHQLSPITGFKPDAGSPLNQQQSRQVLNACF
jgi:hypothetical protein